MLESGEGIVMNKSLAVQYSKLSADQGNAAAQYIYGYMLDRGEGISMNKSLAVIILNYLLIKALQQVNAIMVICFQKVKVF
jgi:TPR repeat protein